MNNFYNPYYYNQSNSTFIGHYITDYSEVLNTAIPTNGEAVLFANLEQGMIWSKKMVNGVPNIQPFKLLPLYQEVQKQPEPINNSADILEELKYMKAEIEKLKGGKVDDSK
jgi:hypothetical protein